MSTRAMKKFTKAGAPGVEGKSSDEEQDEEKSEQDEQEESLPKNRFALLEANSGATKDEVDNNSNVRSSQEASETTANKKQKKNKKKKKTTTKNGANASSAARAADDVDDEIQRILDSLNNDDQKTVVVVQGQKSSSSSAADFRRVRTAESELFTVEYRNLNAENELKRIFGAATTKLFSSGASGGERRGVANNDGPKSRVAGAGGKLVLPKPTWPVFGKTGLSMKLVESRAGGVNVFLFDHGPAYRQAQYEFWEAVETMNPDSFVEIMRNSPYHIDTLLQMSEVLRMQEDFQTSRDLIERAVYGCQVAFHPLFNVASASCRLQYKQRENRPFFLALFKHMHALCQRACVRTALEFCKLIFSLDPDDDPLCMLLIIDYLALRSKQYDYLLDFYRIMEAKRNLSQLPNFCYSIALACYLKAASGDGGASSTQTIDAERVAEADHLLLHAVAKFPTTLAALLEKCEVDATDVKECSAFSTYEQSKDGAGLKQLNSLYAVRTHQLWKEPQTLQWLEGNVRTILPQLTDKGAPSAGEYAVTFREFREHRRSRFKGTPRNILRHIVIADVKEAFVQLPVDVRDAVILSYDPLPPLDTVEAYEKPQRDRPLNNDSFFGSFLRSLLPNYDPTAQPAEEPAVADAAAAAAAAEGGGVRVELQRSVHHVLAAMRDLLNNIQPTALPPEVNQGGGGGGNNDQDDDEPDAWEDEREND